MDFMATLQIHKIILLKMKPIISKSDYNAIKLFIANCPYHLRSKEMNDLKTELDRANIVDNHKVADDIIQLNSIFTAKELNIQKTWTFTLVLPQRANIKEQKISVLSPLGIAMIGFKQGTIINWALPGGVKKIEILNVKKPETHQS